MHPEGPRRRASPPSLFPSLETMSPAHRPPVSPTPALPLLLQALPVATDTHLCTGHGEDRSPQDLVRPPDNTACRAAIAQSRQRAPGDEEAGSEQQQAGELRVREGDGSCEDRQKEGDGRYGVRKEWVVNSSRLVS